MFQKLKVVPEVVQKAHSHTGWHAPGMFEKVAAMQDMLFQRWLKRSQPCKIGRPRDA